MYVCVNVCGFASSTSVYLKSAEMLSEFCGRRFLVGLLMWHTDKRLYQLNINMLILLFANIHAYSRLNSPVELLYDSCPLKNETHMLHLVQ